MPCPLAFNRQEALHEAKRIGMGTDTLDSHLRRMLEKGVIQKNARGEYIFTAKQRQTAPIPFIMYMYVCEVWNRPQDLQVRKFQFSQIHNP